MLTIQFAMRTAFVFALALTLTVLTPFAAFAEEVAAGNVVDFSPLLNYAVEAIAAVALALVLWVVKKLTGNVLDEGARRALYPAIENGIGFAAEYLKRQGRDLTQLEVRNELAREAALYASQAVPAAARRFGFGADEIARLAMAALGLREDVPDPAAPAPPPAGK